LHNSAKVNELDSLTQVIDAAVVAAVQAIEPFSLNEKSLDELQVTASLDSLRDPKENHVQLPGNGQSPNDAITLWERETTNKQKQCLD